MVFSSFCTISCGILSNLTFEGGRVAQFRGRVLLRFVVGAGLFILCLRLYYRTCSRVSLSSINIGLRKQQLLGLPLRKHLFNFLNIFLFLRAQQ